MLRHAAVACLSCIFLFAASCASAPEETPSEEEVFTPPPKPEKQRPIYHAESDAVSLEYRESKALVKVACAGADEPSECREDAGAILRGYPGSFSHPDADELLIAVGDEAVLMAQASGKWQVIARAPGVDVHHCLRAPLPNNVPSNEPSGALVCRAPSESGSDAGGAFGLAFFHLSVDEETQLQVRSLDLPHARDVDAALFAGWKRLDGDLQIRIHSEEEVTGASELDFGGPGSCRFRTFQFQAGGGDFVELDECNDRQFAEVAEDSQSTRRRERPYENRLSEPIRAQNREYSTCYARELERLERERAEAEEDGERADGDEGDEGDAEEEEPEEPLAGNIETRFIIGSAGAPVSCEITETTLQNEQVESCLCREIINTSFPPVPSGKFVDVTYPFGFSP